jgi:hypothetical protein
VVIVYDVTLKKWSVDEDEIPARLLEAPRNILMTEDFKRIYKLRYDGRTVIMDAIDGEDFSNCNLHAVEKFIEEKLEATGKRST